MPCHRPMGRARARTEQQPGPVKAAVGDRVGDRLEGVAMPTMEVQLAAAMLMLKGFSMTLTVGRLKSPRTMLNRIATSEQPHEHAPAAPGRVAAAVSMDVAMGADGDVRSSCWGGGLDGALYTASPVTYSYPVNGSALPLTH